VIRYSIYLPFLLAHSVAAPSGYIYFQLLLMRAFLVQFAVFLAATFLVMEVFFRFSGLAPEIPFARYLPEYALTVSDRRQDSAGWYTYGKQAQIRAPWRINEAGWNSAFDYRRDTSSPLVAIVGDSYVENLYCPPEEHLDYLLAQRLPAGYRAYNFGRRGIPMSHMVPMTRYVRDQVAPDWIVYLLNHRNLGESVARIRRGRYFLQYDKQGDSIFTLPPQPYQSSPQKQWLSLSATFRYFVSNFTFRIAWPRLSLTPAPPPDLPEAQKPENQALQQEIARQILIDITEAAKPARVLFVLHPNRAAIYEGHSPVPETRPMNLIKKELEALDLPYLSLNPAFSAAYLETGNTFEFENNKHWNGYANEVAANAIYEQLNALMGKDIHSTPSFTPSSPAQAE
jgi:hypothetical protein